MYLNTAFSITFTQKNNSTDIIQIPLYIYICIVAVDTEKLWQKSTHWNEIVEIINKGVLKGSIYYYRKVIRLSSLRSLSNYKTKE